MLCKVVRAALLLVRIHTFLRPSSYIASEISVTINVILVCITGANRLRRTIIPLHPLRWCTSTFASTTSFLDPFLYQIFPLLGKCPLLVLYKYIIEIVLILVSENRTRISNFCCDSSTRNKSKQLFHFVSSIKFLTNCSNSE